MKTFSLLVSGAVLFFFGGCDSNAGSVPKPPTPAVSPTVAAPTQATSNAGTPTPDWPVSTAKDDARTATVGGLTFPKPPTWTWQPTSIQFRTLEYQVPGQANGSGAAELVFTLAIGSDFGPTDMNLDRWKKQFRTETGEAAEATEESGEADGMTITLVSAEGSYKAMGAPAPRAGMGHISAIIEAPGRRVFIRLVGPKATVEVAKEAFREMVANATISVPSQ